MEKVVDHFVDRFLSTALSAADRASLVSFLRGKVGGDRIVPGDTLETSLRELLYLVLSAPSYQVG